MINKKKQEEIQEKFNKLEKEIKSFSKKGFPRATVITENEDFGFNTTICYDFLFYNHLCSIEVVFHKESRVYKVLPMFEFLFENYTFGDEEKEKEIIQKAIQKGDERVLFIDDYHEESFWEEELKKKIKEEVDFLKRILN